jgi:hypothetical protein
MASQDHPEDYDVANFDPAVHQVGDDGGPVLGKTGKMLRRRGPAKGNGNGGPAPLKVSGGKARGTDYRPGLLGITQLIAAPLMIVAPEDAWALTQHAPNIVEALQVTSEVSPGLAGLLDRILSVGPWGLVITASLPLLVQVAANHRLIPGMVADALGAEDPAKIRAALGLATARAPQPQPEPAGAAA